mgnify:CR=1 FL=1
MSTKVRSVLKNSGIAFGILGIATAFCFLVQRISESDTHVPLLFVLAVLFVSRFTDGYVYGIVASIIGSSEPPMMKMLLSIFLRALEILHLV